MLWSKVVSKSLSGAVIACLGAMTHVLYDAGRISAIDWDQAGVALIAAAIGGAGIRGGTNAYKHRRRA